MKYTDDERKAPNPAFNTADKEGKAHANPYKLPGGEHST
jgi:hypothetical protein